MAQKMSTALCNQLLDAAPFKDIFAGGYINIYAGAAPATADAAETADPICVVSINSTGTGINWGPTAGATPGVILKAAEVWTGLILDDDTATHFRLVGDADTGALSTTEPRVQGTIGVGGADMNLGSTALVSGATFTLSFASQAFVPS